MCVWVFGQQHFFFGYLDTFSKKQVRHPLATEIEWIFDLPASKETHGDPLFFAMPMG